MNGERYQAHYSETPLSEEEQINMFQALGEVAQEGLINFQMTQDHAAILSQYAWVRVRLIEVLEKYGIHPKFYTAVINIDELGSLSEGMLEAQTRYEYWAKHPIRYPLEIAGTFLRDIELRKEEKANEEKLLAEISEASTRRLLSQLRCTVGDTLEKKIVIELLRREEEENKTGEKKMPTTESNNSTEVIEKITSFYDLGETHFGRALGDYGDFEGFEIVTSKRTFWAGVNNGQACCEDFGHIASEDEDDFNKFIGAKIIKVTGTAGYNDDFKTYPVLDSLKEELPGKKYVEAAELVFLTFETDLGPLQFVAYNFHNGYYGHEVTLLVEDKEGSLLCEDEVKK